MLTRNKRAVNNTLAGLSIIIEHQTHLVVTSDALRRGLLYRKLPIQNNSKQNKTKESHPS